MSKQRIHAPDAPAAIGTYSHAIRTDGLVFCSGQIPLDPATGELVRGGAAEQIRQVFDNLAAVARAAGGSLDDAVKLTVYLKDLADFPLVNEIMLEYFSEPFPARAAIGVAALPKQALVEADAILAL